MKIILASKSKARKWLLEKLGLDFVQVESGIDESKIRAEDVALLVKILAEQKAEAVAKNYKDAIVIGADTCVYFNNRIIGKPQIKEESYRTLKELSGKTHQVFTGLCIINTNNNKRQIDFSKTVVRFRELTDKEIRKYAESDDVLHCAGYGGFAYYSFIESMNGSHTNVIGLPLERLIPMLRKEGVEV